MNRLGINIAIALVIVLLLCVVLERLGMGDVVKGAGDRVREKAGLSAPASAAVPKNGFTNEIERLLGAPLRDILKQPVEMQRIAKEKILAEIDRLKELQIATKGIELEANARIRENDVKRNDLLALLDQARSAAENPNTEYPVKIGNYFYSSRKDLLSHAVGIRKEADRLAAESDEIVNVSPAAVKDARTIARNIDELERALAQLQTIPLLAGGARVGGEVEKLRETVRPWTSVPEQIKDGISDPRKREDGSRESTEEEDFREAFGQ